MTRKKSSQVPSSARFSLLVFRYNGPASSHSDGNKHPPADTGLILEQRNAANAGSRNLGQNCKSVRGIRFRSHWRHLSAAAGSFVRHAVNAKRGEAIPLPKKEKKSAALRVARIACSMLQAEMGTLIKNI